MTILAEFPARQKWPAENPEIIQLYSFPTPNGVKISIALEELSIPYEAHQIRLGTDTTTPEFLSLNPNNKIPAIMDPNGPDSEPITLFESGAILIYLAEKAGKLIGSTPAKKYETIQWLMFQMGGVGPMFGQLGYFAKLAGSEIEDKRPLTRYINEAKRLLNVLDQQLEGKDWITGEYSIADIAIVPWLNGLEIYGVQEAVGWIDYENLVAYHKRFYQRAAVQTGKNIPPRD